MNLFLFFCATSVVLHILEEQMAGFTEYFNLYVMRSRQVGRPVSPLEGVLKDGAGLGLILVALLLGGPIDARLPWVALGFLGADFVQHVIYSACIRGWTMGSYTPGVLTSTLYAVALLALWLWSPLPTASRPLLLLSAGAFGLIANFLFALFRRTLSHAVL